MESFVKGEGHTKTIERIKSLIPELKTEENKLSFVMRLPSKNPAEAKTAIDTLLNDTIK